MNDDESVTSWPAYLLWNIRPDLRAAISEEARELDISLAETVRRILCEHYDLECEPVTLRRGGQVGYDAARDKGHLQLLLRLQPALLDAIRQDAAEAERSMRGRIMDALDAHYAGVTG